MVVLVDAMGGDNAPEEIVNGCIDALYEKEGFDIILIGDTKKINEIISLRDYKDERLKVVNATQVITQDDVPSKAIKNKKDSSMVVGFNMLKEKKADIFLSAGNSGALLAGALLILGRIKGVNRPGFAPVLPTKSGRTLLIDGGANVVCKPVNYLQFGIMGSIYMEERFGVNKPKVGLINVGSEDSKGNDTIKQAYALLSNANINFVGNIEGRDIPDGTVDVAVCDGFLGNVLLKFVEGIGSFILDGLKEIFMKSTKSKLAAFFLKNELKQFGKKFKL